MVQVAEERSDGSRNTVHVHGYITEAETADEHQHCVMSVSAPAIAEGTSHIHRLRVRTSFYCEGTDGHWHWLDIMTDIAVDMPDGTHIHYFCGRTSTDDKHCHEVQGVTALSRDNCEQECEEAQEEKVEAVQQQYHNQPCKNKPKPSYMSYGS